MRYRLFVPKGYDKAKQYPLIVWLHGAGGMGTDNLLQISGDQIPGARLWVSPEVQREHPVFVVAPQSATGWNPGSDWIGLQQDTSMAVGVLEQVTAEFSIDRRRVYLVGQSVGGHAARNLAASVPKRFAAAILVCPTIFNGGDGPQLAQTPIWMFKGEKDSADRARAIIEAIQAAGGHPRYTEYLGAGHDIWTRAFAEPELVGWLFAQVR
jgi:predicted peptidase